MLFTRNYFIVPIDKLEAEIRIGITQIEVLWINLNFLDDEGKFCVTFKI